MIEDKRFTYSDVWGWNIDGFLNVMNGLDRKNDELKERIKELEQENKIHLREEVWLLRFLKAKGFTEDDVIKFKEHMQKKGVM